MKKTYSLYRRSDGSFTGVQLSGSASFVAANTPPEHDYVEGDIDHLSKRLDTSTGAVVDFQPPQPDADHEWDDWSDTQRPRWRKKKQVFEAEQLRAARQAQIDSLERKQPRILRELAVAPARIGEDGKTPAERLQEIEDTIAALRGER